MTRIAILQTTTGIDPTANAAHLVEGVRQAKAGGADMLFTPEMSGLLDRNRERAGANILAEAEDGVLAAVREAAAKEQQDGPRLRRVSMVVEATDADVMGDEPIWAKVNGRDFGTVGKTHDFGAPRFGPDGKVARGSSAAQGASAVRGLHDGEWSVVGWVTSGGYAHTVGKSMAQGYVPAELA